MRLRPPAITKVTARFSWIAKIIPLAIASER